MDTEALLSKCVSIDLEVDPNTDRIQSFAAIRSATADTCTYNDGDLATALRALDEYAAGTEFVLGHNVINHDLPHLREAHGGLKILAKPPIDTLWLNPLAFSRNPYHRLVKHYKDGGFRPGGPATRNSMPASSSPSCETSSPSFRKLARDDPDLLTALHWLATSGEKPAGLRGGLPIGVRDAPKAGRSGPRNGRSDRFSRAGPAPTRSNWRSRKRSGPAGRSPTRSPGSRWPAKTP